MLHLWSGLNTAEEAQAWVESHLQASRDRIAELLAAKTARSTTETLALYDQAAWHLRMAGSQAHVMFMVHPLAPVRDAAQALSQVVAAEGVKLSLNRDVYQALEKLDASKEDAATKYYLERTLLGYRLAGVDRDDATREKIRELADKSTELGMRFARTVQDDVRKIEVADPNELRGLPADFLERFGVRASEAQNGQLVADEPGHAHYRPSCPRARDDLRRQLRAAPPHVPRLQRPRLPHQRARAARPPQGPRGDGRGPRLPQLGRPRHRRPDDGLRRQYAQVPLRRRARRPRNRTARVHRARSLRPQPRSPKALPLTLSDARFWEEQYRRSYYDFDSQSVRPFFPYEQVEAGILAIAGKLFGVRFERNTSRPSGTLT